MSLLSHINITRPKAEHVDGPDAELAWSVLDRLVDGKTVRADDTLRTALWLVEDVLRRTEAPSFRFGRLKARLSAVAVLATKWRALVRLWPGEISRDTATLEAKAPAALEWIDLLSRYAAKER